MILKGQPRTLNLERVGVVGEAKGYEEMFVLVPSAPRRLLQSRRRGRYLIDTSGS
jgi:hypothetical protein